MQKKKSKKGNAENKAKRKKTKRQKDIYGEAKEEENLVRNRLYLPF